MNPELHTFFLDAEASSHPIHAGIVPLYRRISDRAGDRRELIAHDDEFEDLLEDIRDHVRNPDENLDAAYLARLTEFRDELRAIDARRAQASDLHIEIRQSLEEIEELCVRRNEGLLADNDPSYDSWMDARAHTLAEVERLRADPDMAPHLDRVLTNLPELAGIATPPTLAEAARAAANSSSPGPGEPSSTETSVNAVPQPEPETAATAPETPRLVWAGIGSRGYGREPMPPSVLADMTELARRMAADGWHLHSGGADGSDTAFANGTPVEQRTIWLPWPGYNDLSGPDCHPIPRDRLQQALELAERHHPAWERCKQGTRKLHARNGLIVLGRNLDRPVHAVVAYTQGGALQGGTAQGLRIAMENNIPIFNLGSMSMEEAWKGLQELRRSLVAEETGRKEGMARVLHLRNAPPDAIRIDRKTRWGNPFIIGRDGTREEVIAKYRDRLWNDIRAGEISMDDLAGLHGKDLACHCAPQPCHGDVLSKAAAWAHSQRNRIETTAAGSETVRQPDPQTAEHDTWQHIKASYASLYRASGERIHHLPCQEGFGEFRDLVAGAVQHGSCPSRHTDRLEALHRTLQTQDSRHNTVLDAQGRLDDVFGRLEDLKEKMAAEPGHVIETMPGYTAWLRDRDAAVENWRKLAEDPAHREHMQVVAPDMMAPRIAELSNDSLPGIHRANMDHPVPASGQSLYTPSLQPLSQVWDHALAFVDRDPKLLAYAPQFDELKDAVSTALDECRHAPDLLDMLAALRTTLDDSHERMAHARAASEDVSNASRALCGLKSWSDRTGRPIHEAPNFRSCREDADRALQSYEAAQNDPALALHLARADSLGVLAETALPLLQDPRFREPVVSEASLARQRSEQAEEQFSMSA